MRCHNSPPENTPALLHSTCVPPWSANADVGQLLYRIGIRDIGDNGGRSATDALDELDRLGERGRFDVGRDDEHAFVREPPGERAPDAAAGAGDHRRLARELFHDVRRYRSRGRVLRSPRSVR